MQRARIIVADNEVSLAGLLMESLRGKVEKVVATPMPGELLNSLETGNFDLVMVDITLEGQANNDLIKRICNTAPNVSVIAMTDETGLEKCFDQMKQHPECFCLMRPYSQEELVLLTLRALDLRKAKLEHARITEQLELQGADINAPKMPEQTPFDSQQLKRAKKVLRENAVLPIEKAFVIDALKRNEFNVTKASRQVGMQRPNFQALMRKHNLKLSILRQKAADLKSSI